MPPNYNLPNYDDWQTSSPDDNDTWYEGDCEICGDKLYANDSYTLSEGYLLCGLCTKGETDMEESGIIDFTTDELFDELTRRAGVKDYVVKAGDSLTMFDEDSRAISFTEGPARALVFIDSYGKIE